MVIFLLFQITSSAELTTGCDILYISCTVYICKYRHRLLPSIVSINQNIQVKEQYVIVPSLDLNCK